MKSSTYNIFSVIVIIATLGCLFSIQFFIPKKYSQPKYLLEYKYSISETIETLSPKIDHNLKELISDSIIKTSIEYEIDPIFITCFINRASGFNPNAITHSNQEKRYGLMLIPQQEDNTENHIEKNINIGTSLLINKLIENEGDVKKTFNSYFGYNSTVFYEDFNKSYLIVSYLYNTGILKYKKELYLKEIQSHNSSTLAAIVATF